MDTFSNFQSQEDKYSLLKVAQLVAAFEQQITNMDFYEKILKTRGDINYKIPKHFFNHDHQHYAGATALHLSRKCGGHLEIIQLLLKYGADITIQSDEDNTALHAALEKIIGDDDWNLQGKLLNEVVNEFFSTHIRQSIIKNPSDRHGLTHLHIACMADHHAAVEFFLNNGVPVDLVIKEDSTLFPKCTPLHVAVKSCALKTVQVLIQYGANVYLKDKEGMNVIHWLIERSINIVDFLMLESEKRPKNWFPELKVYKKILVLFLDNNKINSDVIVDEIGLSDLHIACATGNVSVVEKVLGRVSRIDYQVNANSHLWPGYTALHFAAHFDLDTVRLLLGKGANITIKNTNGCTPLDICLERHSIQDTVLIMLTQLTWRKITLLDENPKILVSQLLHSMQGINEFRSFLDKYINDINISVSLNSPLWPGYTPLHVAVLFSEQVKNRSNYAFDKVSRDEVEFHSRYELVEECLTRGADVTAQDAFGCTPLHLAFRHQKTDPVRKLLEFHRSSANPIDEHNVSHLRIACAAGDEAVVEKLLESGAKCDLAVLSKLKIYRRNPTEYHHLHVGLIPAGSTPLHVAVAGDSCAIAKLLVDRGADVNAVDEKGATSIHRSLVDLRYSESAISRVLLSADVKDIVVPGVGLSHLHVASYVGDVDAAKRLLDLGADVDARLGDEAALKSFYGHYRTRELGSLSYDAGNTALHLALSSPKVASLLLERGADLSIRNARGRTPVHSIILGEDRDDCATLFVEALGRNKALRRRLEEESGLTALHLVTHRLDDDGVRRFIEGGENVNARLNGGHLRDRGGCTCLHLLVMQAIRDGDDNRKESVVEIMRLLLAAGADVALCNAEGDTPLHFGECVQYTDEFHVYLLNLMLNSLKNFDANPIGQQGLSLFHIACVLNNLPIIEKFIEHGVDINAPINFFNDVEMGEFDAGSSALHLILRLGSYDRLLPRVETICFLLEHGADVDARDVQGNTPLHFAVDYVTKRLDVFQTLISAGADLDKHNFFDKVPLELLLCSSASTPEVIELFITHGCNVSGFNNVNQQGYLAKPLSVSSRASTHLTNTMETLFKSPSITKSDTEGRTAIHSIVSAPGKYLTGFSVEMYSTFITRLCSMGCDIDAQAQSGQTALHFATRFKNHTAIVALMINGADINIVDKCGKTAFNYSFEPPKDNEKNYHTAVIDTFLNHMRKMEQLKLSLNYVNREAVSRALLLDSNVFNKDRINSFLEEMNQIKTLTFEEDSLSFKLSDMLCETGTVAAYPIIGYNRRFMIDTFYDNVDLYLRDYPETIGLFKLQYRKALKRISLISPATKSLKVSVGFAIPDICCRIVLRFLSNSDLINLISSTNYE